MKKALLNLLVMFCCFWQNNAAQSPQPAEHGPDSFLQDAISRYEGLPAPLFKAPDTEGFVHYLDRYKGHVVILHFCQIYSEPSLSQIPSLNRIIDEYFDQGVVVFAFAVESVEDIRMFVKTREIKYPVIPNSLEFSLEHYGGGLGFPRVFVIDKYGIVQKVTLGGKSDDEMDLYNRLKPVIEEHLKY